MDPVPSQGDHPDHPRQYRAPGEFRPGGCGIGTGVLGQSGPGRGGHRSRLLTRGDLRLPSRRCPP
jgi:hypothetical protein